MSGQSMVNPVIGAFGGHPFPRLAQLLAPIDPPDGLVPFDLSIGEPRVGPPDWATSAVLSDPARWLAYPPNAGPPELDASVRDWLSVRFGLPDPGPDRLALVPTAGAREALFQLGLLVAGRPDRPLMAMPTPHYAPYRGAALAAGLTPLYLAAAPEHGYRPDLDVVDRHGPRLSALLLCSPSNPEGVISPPEYLAKALELARRHGFVLIVDECYSELYRDQPPAGALGVAWQQGGPAPARHLLVVNSLSKRSGAAGLRVGVVAGDPELVAGLVALRAYGGGTTPLPNLAVAAALYRDETHVAAIRDGYRRTFDVADEVLGDLPGYHQPDGGIFLWLPVPDGEQAAREAWRRAALRLVPGRYLGPAGHDGCWPGAQHVRAAMTWPAGTTRAALTRLRPVLVELGAVRGAAPGTASDDACLVATERPA